jgi:putative ABC transport system permease protein
VSILLNYGLRSLWVRRRVSLASAVGIGLVVFVLAASQMLARGLKDTLLASSSGRRAIVMQYGAGTEGGSRLRQSALTLVAAAPGIERAATGEALVSGETVNVAVLQDLKHASRLASVQIRGVSQTAFTIRGDVRIVRGRPFTFGSDEAIVGVALADRYAGLALGDGFELKKGRKIKVVGVFEAAGSAYESEVWANLESVRTSLGAQGFFSSITVQLASGRDFDAFASQLAAHRQEGLNVEREGAYYTRVSENLSIVLIGLGGLVTTIFSLGAMLGAMITMHGAVGQRRREIGVLRALGFPAMRILLAFLCEAWLLAMGGGALGIGMALLTSFFHFTTTNVATGQELSFGFVPDFGILAAALLTGALVGIAGGFFPALRAARTSPLAAMRI